MSSFSFLIASRIKNAPTRKGLGGSIRIAIAGIAIGLATMLISVAIVVGFKQEIQQKIAGFGGHLQVLAIASNNTFEKQPICCSDSLLEALRILPSVSQVETFITKPAVLKTKEDFLSVVVRSETDSLEENEILVSETIASKMKLRVGDSFKLFFLKSGEGFEFGQETASIKSRTVFVKGLFQTHFNNYDSQMIIASHSFLQTANDWDEDMASGIEIQLRDFNLLENGYMEVVESVSQNQDRLGTTLYVKSIDQMNPQIFGWLDLLDTNVWVILCLMLLVSSFTMISGLLIIIMERTGMIGLLKALGATNWQLQKSFLYVAAFLTMKGLFWGNLFGLGLCAIQYFWHPITLDAETYYLDWVPIALSGWHILALNLGTLCITLFVLLVPSAIVAHISPNKAIQSE
ncbi:MAG: ABC transporter permease [Bacteroidales bacterium]|nr:ABC transporter permease [Bacteroidales bacterium]